MAQGNLEVSARRILDRMRIEGEPDELGNIAICHFGRERGSLYILVEAQGPRRSEVEPIVLDAITDYFKKASASSVTGALLGAIKEANSVLYSDNRRSMRDQQTRAGMYCALVRPGQDVVLAYAGPSAAVLITDEGPKHLPSGSEHVDMISGSRTPSESTPLGAIPDIDPFLFKSPLMAGDILVMATPSLLESGVDDEELTNALREDGIDGLPVDQDETILVLALPAAGEQAANAGAVVADSAVAEPESAGKGPSIVQTLALMFRPKERADVTPIDAAEAALVAEQVAAPLPPPVRQAAPPKPSAETGIPEWLDASVKAAAPASSKRRVRSTQAAPSRQLGLPHSSRWLIWLGAALAIVLFIAGALWYQGKRQAEAREQQFQDLMSQAESTRTLGQASFDHAQAIKHLTDAEAIVNQALAVKPDAPAALALLDGINRDMDEAKGVVRLAPSQVGTLYTFGAAGSNPTRVIGDGSNLYVLDKGDQKVYKFALNPAGTAVQQGGDSVLVRKGDQVGGVVVGDLIDIAWIPLGGNRKTSNLVVYESGGNLIQYDPAKGLTVLPVKNPGTIRKVQATGGYSGNFYVLDNLSSSIMRYRPEGKGYEGAPQEYLQTKVELVNAVDLSIDGDMFVLLVNGQVLWISNGRPQPFPLEGLDKPMAAPVALFTNEGTESVYVADPTNSRIVKLGKQGAVQKQFVYDDQDATFQRLRGIFADDKKQSIYATSGTKLLQIAQPK